MNMNPIRVMAVAFLVALLPSISSAFYAAHMGRFTTRDPFADRISVATIPDGSSIVSRDIIPHSFSVQTEVPTANKSTEEQTHNLYEYTGGNPVIRSDPSGLFFGWGYGNYCGWSRNGQNGPPIDATDTCCQAHDNCQATWWTCNPYSIWSCSNDLCHCAEKAATTGCKTLECRRAAREIQVLFCPLGLVPAPPEPPAGWKTPSQCFCFHAGKL
jgi:hypothetical protein